MKTHHKLNLFENAIDSLDEALLKYEIGAHETEPAALKFAVLHMAHFMELLLKKYLSDIHPLLLFKDVFKKPPIT